MAARRLDPQRIKTLLLSVADGAAALQGLLDLRKEVGLQAGLRWVCRYTSIRSHGHLSDALAGRRVLPDRYITELAHLFGLTKTAEDVLLALARCDRTRTGDQKSAREHLALCREWLVGSSLQPTPADDLHTIIRVIASFGLFRGRPTQKQLQQYFRWNDRVTADIVHRMLDLGLIERCGDHLVVNHSVNLFDPGDQDGFREVHNAEHAMAQAALVDWYRQPSAAIFETYCASVAKEDYLQLVERLRSYIREQLRQIETDDGDMLAHVNAFVFPEGHPVDADASFA